MKENSYTFMKTEMVEPPLPEFSIGGDGQVAQELRNLQEAVNVLSKGFEDLKVHLIPVMTSPQTNGATALQKEERLVPLAETIRSIRYLVLDIMATVGETKERMEI
jgi:hypothetical protein